MIKLILSIISILNILLSILNIVCVDDLFDSIDNMFSILVLRNCYNIMICFINDKFIIWLIIDEKLFISIFSDNILVTVVDVVFIFTSFNICSLDIDNIDISIIFSFKSGLIIIYLY